MKRADFFRVAILVIGLWSCYQAIFYLAGLLIYVVWLTNTPRIMDSISKNLIGDVLFLLAYTVVAYVSLKRTDWVAAVLGQGKPDLAGNFPETDQAQVLNPGLRPADVMEIVLVGVGILQLLTAVPDLIQNLFADFREKIGGSRDLNAIDLIMPLLRVLLPLLIILIAKRLATQFFPEQK